MSLANRLSSAWNAFMGRDSPIPENAFAQSYSSNPDRIAPQVNPISNLTTPVYNKIAVDVAAVNVRHVMTDLNGRYLMDKESNLNTCLTLSANIDQTHRAFLQDYAYSLLMAGSIAIIPVDCEQDPNTHETVDVISMRVASILEWKPRSIKVQCYNDKTGKKEDIWISKSAALIIENPFYEVMNGRNSTLSRLTRKMQILDQMDSEANSNRLDLIIQLPYIIKSDARKKQAEDRRKSIEQQLSSSKYGIAYTDGTERVMQLNRSIENTLPAQIEALTKQFYSQLCMTEEILNGTATEEVMTNYYVRVIEPLISAFVDEVKRKWLTKTARAQGQSIMFFRDHFELIPASKLADIADKFTRNAIMSSNEFRQVVGLPPSTDPNADALQNKNLYPTEGEGEGEVPEEGMEYEEDYSEEPMPE